MDICTVPWLWGHCFQYRGQYKVETSQCLLFSTEWEYFFHLCLIRQQSRGLSVWHLCVLPGLSASLWHTLIFLTNFLSALDMSNSCFRIVPQRPAVESTKAWKHTGSGPAISLHNDPKHLSPALCFSSGGGGKWLRVSHVSSSLPLWQGWRTACSRDYGLILRLSWGYGLGLCVLD